ncbi:MAG TPA: CotH kinase family protein [Phycisphaerales bacterium]|nr:CotH kinase family protein [Phycisphaerales bacterium]
MPLPRSLLPALASLFLAAAACGQDLYDTTVLRTYAFTFTQSNWETLLRQNYQSQTNLAGSLTVDGITYPNVGVRIRGNTSYTALPAGSQKFSLNVDLDFVNPQQTLYGYQALNLNNGFHDPTFCREVLYNNYVAEFIPNPRACHALVTINGQNWGVYINVQQFDQEMLSGFFADTSGLRIKCANNPSGPGLRYNGSTQTGYTGYEIKDPGGLANPWQPLINVCNALTNTTLTNWATLDQQFAVDASIWSVALENMLTDDDSYVHKGADFVLYRDPADGRMYLLQTDANETFTQTTAWPYNLNFGAITKPVLNRMLAVPELRQRYLAHYRTVKQNLNWAYFEPRALALRDLISAHVQADPKKLYSHALFLQNFNTAVTMPYSGLAGGTVPGLQEFVTGRNNFLNATAELVALGPTINSISVVDTTPNPGDNVTITANVFPQPGSGVSRVDLFYRPAPTSQYLRLQMTALGGGNYAATLPLNSTPGRRISYYVQATASNTYSSLSFLPARAEYAPLSIDYTFGPSGVRFTEFMYSGGSGEFAEITNLSGAPVSLNGWMFDDDSAPRGALDLSPLGTLAHGESAIITDVSPESFRLAWNLPATVKVIGGLGVTGGGNLARNGELNLMNASGGLVDRLVYGDQTFPGTIRTQFSSGQTCPANLGQIEVAAWTLSALGDDFGSTMSIHGDRGTPGSYDTNACNPCSSDFNGDGDAGTDQDIEAFFACIGGHCCDTCDPFGSDYNRDGDAATDQDIEAFFRVLGGGSC